MTQRHNGKSLRTLTLEPIYPPLNGQKAGTCELCQRPTAKQKPLCSRHIESMPYIQHVRQLEEEDAKTRLTMACEQCGKEFERHVTSPATRFCTKACKRKARSLRRGEYQ